MKENWAGENNLPYIPSVSKINCTYIPLQPLDREIYIRTINNECRSILDMITSMIQYWVRPTKVTKLDWTRTAAMQLRSVAQSEKRADTIEWLEQTYLHFDSLPQDDSQIYQEPATEQDLSRWGCH